MTDHMNTADQFKRIIHQLSGRNHTEHRDLYIQAMETLQAFEATPWIAEAFKQALAAQAEPIFRVTDGTVFVASNVEIDKQVEMIEALLATYVRLVNPPVMESVYDMKEAAAYLGISDETFKTYVSREKRVHGTKKGGSLLFTREQLDAFNRTRQKPGHPKAKVDSF